MSEGAAAQDSDKYPSSPTVEYVHCGWMTLKQMRLHFGVSADRIRVACRRVQVRRDLNTHARLTLYSCIPWIERKTTYRRVRLRQVHVSAGGGFSTEQGDRMLLSEWMHEEELRDRVGLRAAICLAAHESLETRPCSDSNGALTQYRLDSDLR